MEVKERPILFSDSMVRALLSGQKSQTRRVVKPQPDVTEQRLRELGGWIEGMTLSEQVNAAWQAGFIREECPYGQPGDRLWVRENGWERPARTPKMMREGADTWASYYYDSDGISADETADFKSWGFKRRPSIHMPRWACRLVLEIVSVRVERLQDISEADAMAEGCAAVEHAQWFEGMKLRADGSRVRQECRGEPPADWTEIRPLSSHDPFACTAKDAFRRIWYSINGAESWAANPWVWCIEFRKVQP